MKTLKREETTAKIKHSVEELLQWAQEHPHCTLEELEDRVQKWKTQVGAELLEEAVMEQGAGVLAPEETCACGGRWVFQGYRVRKVMTSQGMIRVRRAYFTCERCGAGIFPPGGGERDSGGLE